MGDLGDSRVPLVVLRGPRIAAADPGDPEVPQVAADARLVDHDPPLAQHLHQLHLALHPVARQERKDLLLAAFTVFVVVGHGVVNRQIHAHHNA